MSIFVFRSDAEIGQISADFERAIYGQALVKLLVTTHGVSDLISLTAVFVTGYRVPEIFAIRQEQHISHT